jgi:hypothetical protein
MPTPYDGVNNYDERCRAGGALLSFVSKEKQANFFAQ